MKTYIPATWHNNYDNSHNLKVARDGTIKPNAAYQAFADERNLDYERLNMDVRLVWDDVTTSFVLRDAVG